MKRPELVERFSDNGEHSHWELIDDNGEVLWVEPPKDESIFAVAICHDKQLPEGRRTRLSVSHVYAISANEALGKAISIERSDDEQLSTYVSVGIKQGKEFYNKEYHDYESKTI